MNKTAKSRKGGQKARPEVGAGFGPRLGDEITCANDFGGSQVSKKRWPGTSIENGSDSTPRNSVPDPRGEAVVGGVNPPNWKIGRFLNLNHLSPEGWWDLLHVVHFGSRNCFLI